MGACVRAFVENPGLCKPTFLRSHVPKRGRPDRMVRGSLVGVQVLQGSLKMWINALMPQARRGDAKPLPSFSFLAVSGGA